MKGDAGPGALCDVLAYSVEVLLNVGVPQDGVVDAMFRVFESLGNLVVSGGVGVAGCHVSPGQVAVLASAPRGEEGGQVPVLLLEWHRVVPVPGIQDRLCAVGRYKLALQERCLGPVGLP